MNMNTPDTHQDLSPRRERLMQAFRVEGPTLRTRNADEADPARARIPGLWAQCLAGARPPGPLHAVYHAYESDHDGAYSLCLGEANPRADAPGVLVPAGDYLVFEARGEMPQALIQAWAQVWRYFAAPDAPRRSYRADFERHLAPGCVELHIGVQA